MKIALSARNGIFEGLYFVSSGVYISYLLNKGRINFKFNISLFIGSIIAFIFEIYFLKNITYIDDGSLYLSFLTLIPSFFVLLLKFNLPFNTEFIRNYSTGIYFIHPIIIKIVEFILTMLDIKISKIYVFIIVLLITLSILTFLYKINNKKINYLIK